MCQRWLIHTQEEGGVYKAYLYCGFETCMFRRALVIYALINERKIILIFICECLQLKVLSGDIDTSLAKRGYGSLYGRIPIYHWVVRMRTTKMHTLAHSLFDIHANVHGGADLCCNVHCNKVFQMLNNIHSIAYLLHLFLLWLSYADKVYCKLSRIVTNNCSENVARYPWVNTVRKKRSSSAIVQLWILKIQMISWLKYDLHPLVYKSYQLLLVWPWNDYQLLAWDLSIHSYV